MQNKNSSLLSGVALYNEGSDSHNGILYSYEIEKQLMNADLVVLPGCETGQVSDRSVASFAQSFIYANASALVVSLWHTQDEATKSIMIEFYERLADGLPKDVALRMAKLKYIKNNPNVFPGAWSTFIHIGNNNPVKILRNNGMTYYALLGLFAIIGIIIILLTKFK